MRAKFKLKTVTSTEHSEQLKFEAVGKDGAYGPDGLDENNTFAKWTPTGLLELSVANPALIGKFKPGQCFYLDFTEVPAVASKE